MPTRASCDLVSVWTEKKQVGVNRLSLLTMIAIVLAAPAGATELPKPFQEEARPASVGGARFTGRVAGDASAAGSFVLELRNGRALQVDAAQALQTQPVFLARRGVVLMVEGSLSKSGVLIALNLLRAKNGPGAWLPDTY
jgi:hypothetical protein